MSLRFPLVFWNEPPELSFTSCVIIKTKDRIITGTHCGLCVLWVVQKETVNDEKLNTGEEERKERYSVEPFAVLSGHECAVTAMTECVYDFAPAVCSGKISSTLI
jgi:hypothetical protein